MKVLLCLLGLLSLGSVSVASDIVLVDRGKAVSTIIAGSSEVSQKAAIDLQSLLKRITSAQIPIVSEPSQAKGVHILIGQDASRDAAASLGIKIPSGLTSQFSDEGYVIACTTNQLILAGNETEPYEGTYYAVYDFLQSLGCRWYMPGKFGEVIPRLDTIKIKQGIRIIRPELRIRDVWYSGHLVSTPSQQAEFAEWKRHNRLSKTTLWQTCMAPNSIYLQNPSDDTTKRLLPKEKYFSSHPEYYALNSDGTRNPDFLCVSNPEAIKTAAGTIIQYFKDNPDAHSYAFSPPDAPVLCNCEQCIKAMHGGFGGEGYGDVSDPYFTMVMKIADIVKEVYPDRWIITMAYYNRCRPPEGIDGKRSNLLIQYAYIQQCTNHSYETKNCWTRSQFGSMLSRWGELASGLIAYDYDPHDWTHSQKPFWRAHRLAEDMRFAGRIGSWGYSDEGMMAWLTTGLNYYVRARLAWNLNDDVDKIENDFFTGFFGPASEPVKKYYTSIETALENSRHHLGWGPDDSPRADDFFSIIDGQLMGKCAGWLSEADKLAASEPYKTRVSAFKGQFYRLESLYKARKCMAEGNWKKAVSYTQGMLDAVKMVNDTSLLQDAGPWGGDASGAAAVEYAKRIAAYTDGTAGRLISVIGPDARFKTDPGPDGLTHRWYLPDAGKNWPYINLTSGWYNQGYVQPDGRNYTGNAWYRAQINLKDSVPGTANILIPEMKGGAVWVWVNGMFADNGQKGGSAWNNEDMRRNIILNISGLLKPGRNTIVFRVHGFGGFSLPPFIYEPR